jgi:Domain of unknown function (DUF6398)
MAADDELGRVPRALRARVGEIVALSDTACAEHLDAEYATLCRRLVAKLARKRPSPIERGAEDVWAAGALYAIGQNNFLFDPSQTPHLSAEDLSLLTGVPKSTMAAKAKRIRDAVGLDCPMDPEFCRRELLAEHPMAWLVEVDGLIVDARMLPAELQAEARRRGLIPALAFDNAA